MPSTNSIYAAAIRACKSNDWKYTEATDRKMIKMSFNVKTKFGAFNMLLDVKPVGIITYGIVPIRGDKDTEATLLRYVAMANYGLIDGNFEYDVRDGEIRYKSYLPAYEELTDDAIEHSVGCVVKMIERYGNGFGKLAYGISDPETEIAEAEKGSHSLPSELRHRLGLDTDGDDGDDSSHGDSDDIGELLRRLIEGQGDGDDDDIDADIEDATDDDEKDEDNGDE